MIPSPEHFKPHLFPSHYIKNICIGSCLSKYHTIYQSIHYNISSVLNISAGGDVLMVTRLVANF